VLFSQFKIIAAVTAFEFDWNKPQPSQAADALMLESMSVGQSTVMDRLLDDHFKFFLSVDGEDTALGWVDHYGEPTNEGAA
jgi:hypothetical protein